MRSITKTLTLSLSLAATVIFLSVLGIVIFLDIVSDSKAGCQATVAILSRAVAIGADGSLSIHSTEDLQEIQASSPNLWYAISYSGRIAEYERTRRPELPFSIPYAGPTGLSIFSSVDDASAVCIDVKKKGDSQLVIITDGANISAGEFIKAFVGRNTQAVLLLAMAFAVTVASGAMLSARFVARSIARVTGLALAINPSAPHASIPLDDVPAELTALVSALNRAFAEIDTYIRRQRRFLGNAAHELRTPLTLLRTKIESVQDPALRTELVRDVRRLTSLVSAMLDLARLRDGEIKRQSIDLVSVTREVLADFTPIALDIGIELSLEHDGSEVILVDGVEAAIHSALANLVGNALIHARGATSVIAKVTKGFISISDNGSGLPNGQANNLIEPFQKGESSTQGAGLGLSIVNEIMLAHGGSLTIASTPGLGTIANLNFAASTGSASRR